MNNKYLAISCSILAVIIPVTIFFEILMHKGFTPLYTNSISFDAKIDYIQKKKIKQVDLLAIGSSMTLNNLNSRVIEDSLNTSYFNFSCWGLVIGDTKQLIIKYLPKYKPKYVLICSSLLDFTRGEDTTIHNYLNTGDFFKDYFKEYFYLKNYNSFTDIKVRKITLDQSRVLTNDYASLNFDKDGAVMLDIPRKNISVSRWNEEGGFPNKYTNQQYQQLIALCKLLKDKGVLLIFIQPPIKKSYVGTVKSQQIVDAHFFRCKQIIEQYNGVYMNFFNKSIFSNDSLFVDPFHLSATGAMLFTKEVAHQLKNIKGLSSSNP